MDAFSGFIMGIIIGLILGTIVYEFFTYPVMKVIFKRHELNGREKTDRKQKP